MICRHIEFKDEKDRKVMMKWIVEIEHVFYTFKRKDGLKVGLSSHMLKDGALRWWNDLHEAIGTEGIISLTR